MSSSYFLGEALHDNLNKDCQITAPESSFTTTFQFGVIKVEGDPLSRETWGKGGELFLVIG